MTKNDILLPQYAIELLPAGDDAYTAVMPQVSEDFFRHYEKKLTEAGYHKDFENEIHGSGEHQRNLFATYCSKTRRVDLGYHEAMGRMYATYSPMSGAWVSPAPKNSSDDTPDKRFPTLLTQLGCERFYPTESAACYLLRAADGGFVIIDSAMGDGVEELIYRVLKKQAPDPDHIHIHAWILTHPHGDHVYGFQLFAQKYAADPSIKISQLVCNFADPRLLAPVIVALQEEVLASARRFASVPQLCKPHTGNLLRFADLTFCVLYTQEDYLALRPEVIPPNASSLVLRLTVLGGSSVLFGADHPVYGSYNGVLFCEGALYRWYGDALQSDAVTVFHHGYGGGADKRIYPTVRPKYVLWPISQNRIYKDEHGTPYATPICDFPFNRYFTDPEEAKRNGVIDYFISGDTILTMRLDEREIQTERFSSEEEYFE